MSQTTEAREVTVDDMREMLRMLAADPAAFLTMFREQGQFVLSLSAEEREILRLYLGLTPKHRRLVCDLAAEMTK
jgi:hypothetical protein